MNAPAPMTASLAVAATPTRDHDEENFPTASLLLAKPLRNSGWGTSVLAGAAGGVAIYACYFVGFGLTDDWK